MAAGVNLKGEGAVAVGEPRAAIELAHEGREDSQKQEHTSREERGKRKPAKTTLRGSWHRDTGRGHGGSQGLKQESWEELKPHWRER